MSAYLNTAAAEAILTPPVSCPVRRWMALSEIENHDRELARQLLLKTSPLAGGDGSDRIEFEQMAHLTPELRDRVLDLPVPPPNPPADNTPSALLLFQTGQASAERLLLGVGITRASLQAAFPGAFVRSIQAVSTDAELNGHARIGVDPGPNEHSMVEIRAWFASKLGYATERVAVKPRDKCCKRSCTGCLSARSNQDAAVQKRWRPTSSVNPPLVVTPPPTRRSHGLLVALTPA